MQVEKRVKEILKARNIKAKDLAKQLGVSAVAFSNSINQEFPSLRNLDKIARLLNVSVLDLIKTDEEIAKESSYLHCPYCGKKVLLQPIKQDQANNVQESAK